MAATKAEEKRDGEKITASDSRALRTGNSEGRPRLKPRSADIIMQAALSPYIFPYAIVRCPGSASQVGKTPASIIPYWLAPGQEECGKKLKNKE